jgi:hypothetical protein
MPGKRARFIRFDNVETATRAMEVMNGNETRSGFKVEVGYAIARDSEDTLRADDVEV